MSKKCWICKNTEDYFLEQKKNLIEAVETQIKECETFSATIIESTKAKLGFSDENKTKVKNIKSVYSEMTFNAVFENRNNFLQLEPNLEIIFDYTDKYYGRNPNFKTVKDVIDMFLQEPVEQRYSSELRMNDRKLENLRNQKADIEKITTFFIEKEITSSSIDNVRNKLKNNAEEPRRNFSFGFNRFNDRNLQKEEKSFDFSFSRLGFEINRKIYLCPICVSLLGESALASFEIKEAQRRALEAAMDDDWGDEDDDW